MGKRTCLFNEHVKANAKLVDFSGWEMPLHYGSQLDEHLLVRQDCGMFDVSHMVVVDIKGPGASDFLRRLLANDVKKCKEPGKAIYGCMLNERGGIIDDLITYKVDSLYYRLVVNAGTAANDIAWMEHHQEGYDIRITPRPDLAIIAIQGPNARSKFLSLLPEDAQTQLKDIKAFNAKLVGEWFVACTGYTGEDGFEVVLPIGEAPALWNKLLALNVAPIGLGARDTLRLEAGLNLYGQDMTEDVTPLESNIAWTVSLTDDRAFIGKEALLVQKEKGIERRLVGLVIEPNSGILRHDMVVTIPGNGQGTITSGSFSPTLGRAIALARIPAAEAEGNTCLVEIRKKDVKANIITLPFVRQGKPNFEC